jgi:hypothetical protein
MLAVRSSFTIRPAEAGPSDQDFPNPWRRYARATLWLSESWTGWEEALKIWALDENL